MLSAVSVARGFDILAALIGPAKLRSRGRFLGAMLCLFVMTSSMLGFTGLDGTESPEPIPATTLAMVTVTLTVSATSTSPTYVGEPVTFYATGTSDIVASTLTFQINFDATLPGPINNTASPYEVGVDTNPGEFQTDFTYDEPGRFLGSAGTYYIAKVWVTDGDTVKTATAFVFVIENRDPYFSPTPQPTYDAVKDVPLKISTTVCDADDDALTVDWNFGDDTTHGINVTAPAALGAYVSQVHTWSPYVAPGEGEFYVNYGMNITLDDGQGGVASFLSTIRVFVPKNSVPLIAISGPTRADPTDAVLFKANATDGEGEALTWTFDFGDGTVEVHHTDATAPRTLVWMNVTHVFGVVGNYTVRVYVTDVVYPNVVQYHNVSTKVDIRIAINVLPYVQDRISVSSDNPMIQTAIGGIVVRFSLDVADLDGDVLTATWRFDDGSENVTNVTAGGTKTYRLIQYHNYTAPGSPNITVAVTDGRLGHEILRYRIINVSLNNSGPKFASVSIIYPAETGDFVAPNATVGIRAVIKDAEFDPLYVTIKFGDGSPWLNLSLADFVDGNVSFVANHSYAKVGEYAVAIVVTDDVPGVGKHTVQFNLTVKVDDVRIAGQSVWSWWDSTCLGVVFLIPVLFAVWIVVITRRHKLLEKAGLTVEQYMTRKREVAEELKQFKEGGEP